MHLGQLHNPWQTQIKAVLGVGVSLHSAHFIQWGHRFGRYCHPFVDPEYLREYYTPDPSHAKEQIILQTFPKV